MSSAGSARVVVTVIKRHVVKQPKSQTEGETASAAQRSGGETDLYFRVIKNRESLVARVYKCILANEQR